MFMELFFFRYFNSTPPIRYWGGAVWGRRKRLPQTIHAHTWRVRMHNAPGWRQCPVHTPRSTECMAMRA